jgi:L-ribulokinase
VINGGGVPQKNETLNRVYANVLNKPVLVPEDDVTSLGSAIMAFMAAGAFESIEQAQQALCPRYRTVQPDASESRACEQLYALYRKLYFAFGKPDSEAVAIGDVLPALRKLAAQVRQEKP